MLTDNTFRSLVSGLASENAATELEAMLFGPQIGQSYFVNADTGYTNKAGAGSDRNDGKSPRTPFLTMAKALLVAQTLDTIYFWGDVREELFGGNRIFDLSIVGLGSKHHPDSPGTGYRTGGSMIRPPASPTAATPTLTVRGRGWKFVNVTFDAPVDAAAVKLSRNALSDTAEYDPSHARFIGCRFVDGKYGIEDDGGIYNVTVEDCEFKGFTTCAIVNTSTAVANPLNWKIRNCRFPSDTSGFGNAVHIDSPLNSSYITDSIFGTVVSTGKYIDLTGGNNNIVTKNVLAGLYDTTDYVPGTGDIWYGNRTVVKATYSPDGDSIQVPGA